MSKAFAFRRAVHGIRRACCAVQAPLGVDPSTSPGVHWAAVAAAVGLYGVVQADSDGAAKQVVRWVVRWAVLTEEKSIYKGAISAGEVKALTRFDNYFRMITYSYAPLGGENAQLYPPGAHIGKAAPSLFRVRG